MRHFFMFSFVALTLFASSAQAGFYVDPFIGYIKGQTDTQTTVALGSTTGKLENSGITYGTGLGWTFPNKIRLGADIEFSSQELKDTTNSTTSKASVMTTYITLGYEFPEEIHAYLGGGSTRSVDDQSPKTTMTGVTLKAGAYKELVKNVSFGGEWMLHTWAESTTEGSASVKITDLYEKFNSSSIHLYFRFPFEFGGK